MRATDVRPPRRPSAGSEWGVGPVEQHPGHTHRARTTAGKVMQRAVTLLVLFAAIEYAMAMAADPSWKWRIFWGVFAVLFLGVFTVLTQLWNSVEKRVAAPKRSRANRSLALHNARGSPDRHPKCGDDQHDAPARTTPSRDWVSAACCSAR